MTTKRQDSALCPTTSPVAAVVACAYYYWFSSPV
jgi:hypothetical protein